MGVYIASVSGSSWQFKQWPWYSRRAAARAVGVRRPLHRGGSSVWIDEHIANTSAKWCSSRGQQLEKVSSQGSVQSGIDFETFITTGLLRDPVCRAGDWEGVRPWPRPLPAGRGPDGADGRTPDDEEGKEKTYFAVNGRCLIFHKSLESQPHGVQRAERPRLRSPYPRAQHRHQTRVLFVHCHPNHFHNFISPWGQNTLGVCRCRYYDAKLSTKIAKWGPVRHIKSVQLLVACP